MNTDKISASRSLSCGDSLRGRKLFSSNEEMAKNFFNDFWEVYVKPNSWHRRAVLIKTRTVPSDHSVFFVGRFSLVSNKCRTSRVAVGDHRRTVRTVSSCWSGAAECLDASLGSKYFFFWDRIWSKRQAEYKSCFWFNFSGNQKFNTK